MRDERGTGTGTSASETRHSPRTVPSSAMEQRNTHPSGVQRLRACGMVLAVYLGSFLVLGQLVQSWLG